MSPARKRDKPDKRPYSDAWPGPKRQISVPMTEQLRALAQRKCQIAHVSMQEAVRQRLLLWQPKPTTTFIDELDRALAALDRIEKTCRAMVKTIARDRKTLEHVRRAETRRRPKRLPRSW